MTLSTCSLFKERPASKPVRINKTRIGNHFKALLLPPSPTARIFAFTRTSIYESFFKDDFVLPVLDDLYSCNLCASRKISDDNFLNRLITTGYKDEKILCPETKIFATDHFGRTKLNIFPAASFTKNN
jgi:hypothetical protein